MRTRIFWINGIAWKLAIMPRPRGGEDLLPELQTLRTQGVDVLANLLTAAEMREMDLQAEPDVCHRVGITYLSLSIEDTDVPADASAVRALVAILAGHLREHKGVAIHCRGGIGRSSLVAACVLHALGQQPEVAFDMISKARGVRVPDTQEQRDWAADFCRNM